MSKRPNKWWGEFELAESKVAHWQIGPLDLWIQHLKNEWRIAHSIKNDPLLNDFKSLIPSNDEDLTTKENLARYGFSKSSNKLALKPILADRAIVTQPETPFSILPGEKITVYVSTPLWIQIQVSGKTLQEVPVFRPSDTWFGPSTLEGELCYASKTNCRLRLEELPSRLHRATTAVHIDNTQEKALLLENLNLPLKYLSLHQAEDGQIWTESVTFKQSHDSKLSYLQVEKRLPLNIKIIEKISSSREKIDKNILVRAFSTLFN